ncbi:MAG: hypothetical protein RIG77_12600 [Cyclobacteriaceae bacterium]
MKHNRPATKKRLKRLFQTFKPTLLRLHLTPMFAVSADRLMSSQTFFNAIPVCEDLPRRRRAQNGGESIKQVIWPFAISLVARHLSRYYPNCYGNY